MKAYTIFDDFSDEAIDILESAGVKLTVHPLGKPRPNNEEIKNILEEYDCVIIGTSQKIYPEMFENITKPRIIATASVGLDHIQIPEDKKKLITIVNTPNANAQSVAEYTIGMALNCCKRIGEGACLYRKGSNNKSLSRKPEDLHGKTMGVVGAGNISKAIISFARFSGMNVLCWTAHPERHTELNGKVQFSDLQRLFSESDVVSVNLPNNSGTQGLISKELIEQMKNESIFISVSRIPTVDFDTLLERAVNSKNYYVCLDIDVEDKIVERIPNIHNFIITPHIAGGTVETRKRMFNEVALLILDILRNNITLQ